MTEAEELELLQLQSLSGGTQRPDHWAKVPGMGAPGQVPDTIQEEHPKITFKDRLVTKNLSSSPEATLKYLQKEHPDLEIKTDPVSGQVKIKGQGESQYRVLDPDTGFSTTLKELGKDVLDVGYDVASGIGSGIATAAGGIAGAPSGPGALLSAGAAGAGASAGLEAARQGLGSAFGLENNIDPSQIGIAGAAGAISPLLFGTGATAANAAGKGYSGKLGAKLASVLGRELPAEGSAAAKALLQSQRGLPSRVMGYATEKALPGFASKLAGVAKSDVDDLAKNLDVVRDFETNPASIEKAIRSTVEDSSDKFRTALTKLNNEMEDKLAKEVGNKIDISTAIEPWEQKLKELSAAAVDPNASGADQEAYQVFKNTYEKVFGKPKAIAFQDKLVRDPTYFSRTPKQFRTIQENISELANWDTGLRVQSGAGELNPADRVINLTAKGSYDLMNQALPDSIRAIKDKQAELIGHREFLQKVVNTPQKFISTMRKASADKLENVALNDQLGQIDKLIGTKLNNARSMVNAADKFGRSVPWLSTKRIPSTLLGAVGGIAASRTMPQGEGGLGGFAPGIAGGAIGGILGGPKMVRFLLERARRGGTGSLAPLVKMGVAPTWNMMNKGKK